MSPALAGGCLPSAPPRKYTCHEMLLFCLLYFVFFCLFFFFLVGGFQPLKNVKIIFSSQAAWVEIRFSQQAPLNHFKATEAPGRGATEMIALRMQSLGVLSDGREPPARSGERETRVRPCGLPLPPHQALSRPCAQCIRPPSRCQGTRAIAECTLSRFSHVCPCDPMRFSRQEHEWAAISSSRGSSQPSDRTLISCVDRRVLYPY